jgi:tRNA(Ile)-lysidine synthase
MFGDVEFVRPLLCVRRAEIIEYLQQKGLKWRTDRTNEDLKHRRNFIRHKLLPKLQKETEGSLALMLCQLARAARSFHKRVCNRADELSANAATCKASVVELDTEILAPEHPEVQVEMVRRSLKNIGSGERDFSSEHYERILELIKSGDSGRAIELPGGYMVHYEYGKMLFSNRDTEAKTKENSEVYVEVPGRTKFGDNLIEAEVFEAGQRDFEQFRRKKDAFVEWFDFEKIKEPLAVRARKAGDRFWPLGHEAEKKIGKFLTAAKVRREIRQKSLVVADAEKIIWVWPVRISAQAKVTTQTKKILQLQIKNSET